MRCTTWIVVGLVAALCALVLSCIPDALRSGDRSEKNDFGLQDVFSYKPNSWKGFGRGALSPSGKFVYFVHGAEAEVIDWQGARVVGRRSFSDLPCASEDPVSRLVSLWLGSARGPIAEYCGSLYSLEEDSLELLGELSPVTEDAISICRISPDGRWAAFGVYVYGETDAAERSERILLYDIASWTVTAEWPVAYGGLAFSMDSRLLAIGKWRSEGMGGVDVGVEVREIPDGTIRSAWWGSPDSFDPLYLRFFSREGQWLVTERGSPYGFITWDIEHGTPVRSMESERPLMGFLVDPLGRWLIGDVSNDWGDTLEYSQELRLWDLSSGLVAYETPRVPWSKRGFRESDGFSLDDVSQDGKYVLVTRDERLVLYEVSY